MLLLQALCVHFPIVRISLYSFWIFTSTADTVNLDITWSNYRDFQYLTRNKSLPFQVERRICIIIPT